MSSLHAKRSRLFAISIRDGIEYSVWSGPANKVAGNNYLVDLRFFMPVMNGINGNPWNERNKYLLDPQSGEVFSTAKGTLIKMDGTTDPTVARTFRQRTLLSRLHPSRIINFCGYRFSRSEIMNYFKVFYDAKIAASKGKTGDLFTQADIPSDVPKPNPAVVHTKISHKNQGKIQKGNWLIGKVKLCCGSETLEFSNNPKIHSSEESVKTEMARLANQFPGEKFACVQIGFTVMKVGLDWS